jgi:Ca-activated chloride channel family protein
MKLEARLVTNKFHFDDENTTHLVVSLTAPPVDVEQTRPKLAMVLCVDVSSSMAGEKLEYVKQSALKIIEHLKHDDILGIVTFGSKASTAFAPARVRDKDALRKVVAGLKADGMTNFSGGLLMSLELLKALDIGGDYIHRVIMLTDGAANVGPAKTSKDIINLLTSNREHVTCSAFGYGSNTQGEFDSNLLTEFAREGKGNYAHVENPDKALKAFGTELGGLISTYATNIDLYLKPTSGHVINSVVSDVDVDDNDSTGEVHIQIPDLLAEEARHIVVAVRLAKQKTHGPRAVNVFDLHATYQTFDAQGKKHDHTEETKVKAQFVRKEDLESKPDPSLDAIVGLAQLVRAQIEAEEAAKKGSYQAAADIMAAKAADFGSRGLLSLAAVSRKLGSSVDSADKYVQNASYLRSFQNGASRGLGVSCYAGGADSDLANLGVQMNTTTTTNTSNAFAGVTVQPAIVQPAIQETFVEMMVHPSPPLHMVQSFIPDPGVGTLTIGMPPLTPVSSFDFFGVDPSAHSEPDPSPTHEAKHVCKKEKSKKQSRKSW